MAEYLRTRCCMCPNIQQRKNVCPGIPGTPHPNESICRYVKVYIDERGWLYKVMSGIGPDAFKARYKKPDSNSWKGLAAVKWQKTFDEAQSELNALAEKKGWSEFNGEDAFECWPK